MSLNSGKVSHFFEPGIYVGLAHQTLQTLVFPALPLTSQHAPLLMLLFPTKALNRQFPIKLKWTDGACSYTESFVSTVMISATKGTPVNSGPSDISLRSLARYKNRRRRCVFFSCLFACVLQTQDTNPFLFSTLQTFLQFQPLLHVASFQYVLYLYFDVVKFIYIFL